MTFVPLVAESNCYNWWITLVVEAPLPGAVDRHGDPLYRSGGGVQRAQIDRAGVGEAPGASGLIPVDAGVQALLDVVSGGAREGV